MFCGNCGTQCPDGTKFCSKCGKPLHGGQTTQGQTNNFNNGVSDIWKNITDKASVRSTHPAVNQLKKMATSPLFLIAIIAFSVSILSTIISSGTLFTRILEYIEDFVVLVTGEIGSFSDMEDFEEVMSIIKILDRISFSSTLIFSIPSIVIAVGMWLIFAHALSKTDEYMPTTGFTVIRVVCMITKVLSIISTVGTVILSLVNIIGSISKLNELREYYAALDYGEAGYFFKPDFSEYEKSIWTLVMISVLFIAIEVFIVYYWSKIIQTIDSLKYIASTGAAYYYFSKFVPVMCFIQGGTSLLGIGFTGFSGFMTVVSLVCFGLLILNINSSMMKVSIESHRNFVEEQKEAARIREMARQPVSSEKKEQ